MGKLSYKAKLIFKDDQDRLKIIAMLESQRFAWNECSKIQFGLPNNSVIDLHAAFYKKFRICQEKTPSQVVISAERSVLSAYRSIKSNGHNITSPPLKKRLSLQLDKRSYSAKNGVFSIISLDKRVKCRISEYPRIKELLSKYKFCDPQIFSDGQFVWIALIFETPDLIFAQTSAVGVDLGKRMAAVTSEGKFYQDKIFNGQIRKLRFLKRKLQSAGSKSAKRHLKILRRKERNKNKKQSEALANAIIKDSVANTIVLENLKGIKSINRHKGAKNSISQVPFYQLKQILSYKAPLAGKTVISVNPRFTSQIDHRTGKCDGTRKGRRYYGKDGVILDSDQNAAINIAVRSQLPVSLPASACGSRGLDGQAVVTRPIVCKSFQSLD